ncbi:MAG: NotI family restriction endonuclease [Coprothermobacterota bacterium]|nr:NotI family restriction endonuclease [Coprothermobacterota bacterium]
MIKQPLAEVFGFPTTNLSSEAEHCRANALCRFGNKVPKCTKDKANKPLGVCSIYDGTDVVITCPIRFREQWLIAEDAASFFFPKGSKWTTLIEVRLKDKYGKSAGNIDVALCSYNDRGKVIGFGALEVQAVYISGNVRNPFEHYMEAPEERTKMDWSARPNYPKPDYLSSSRKRLAPQLIFKGGILKAWGKKTAVALNRGFFNTLPTLQEIEPERADIAWLVYDLVHDKKCDSFSLKRWKAVYTKFTESLEKITRSEPGNVRDFVEVLQEKVDEKLDNNHSPDTEVIGAPF